MMPVQDPTSSVADPDVANPPSPTSPRSVKRATQSRSPRQPLNSIMPAEEVAAAAVGEAVTVDEILPKDPSEDVDGGSDEGSDESSADGSDDDSEENYERERQRQIQENQRLLFTLGIASGPSGSGTSSTSMLFPKPASPAVQDGSPVPRKKVKRDKTAKWPIYDRSGHILSLPSAGQTHVVSCVEIPSDRRIKRQIADGEYQDCLDWAEGEDRRWRFGSGRGKMEDGEEADVGGVGEDFRWRKWKGLQKELMREMARLEGLNDADQDDQDVILLEDAPVVAKVKNGVVSAYSLIPGAPCHQCRRKSEKPKMECRNLDPLCRAKFCETCCKRYSYFEFDPEARNFLCPLCKNCCNCSNCIRKRNLEHLLEGKQGLRTLKATKGEGETIEDVLQKAVKDKVGVLFERVRLVNRVEDVISPELPPEAVVKIKPTKSKTTKAKKSKKGKSEKEKENIPSKAVGVPKEIDGATIAAAFRAAAQEQSGSAGAMGRVMLRFKVPSKPNSSALHGPQSETHPALPISNNHKRVVKVKEIDSDGDTIDGADTSDEEIGEVAGRDRSESALTALTDEDEDEDQGSSSSGSASFTSTSAAHLNGGRPMFGGYYKVAEADDATEGAGMSGYSPALEIHGNTNQPSRRRAFPPRDQQLIDTNAYLSSLGVAQARDRGNGNRHEQETNAGSAGIVHKAEGAGHPPGFHVSGNGFFPSPTPLAATAPVKSTSSRSLSGSYGSGGVPPSWFAPAFRPPNGNGTAVPSALNGHQQNASLYASAADMTRNANGGVHLDENPNQVTYISTKPFMYTNGTGTSNASPPSQPLFGQGYRPPMLDSQTGYQQQRQHQPYQSQYQY